MVLEYFGFSVRSYATFMVALATLFALVFFGTASLILWRKSDDRISLLFALALVLGGTMPVLLTMGLRHSASWLPISFVGEMALLSFFLAFTLFPDGRFVPRWTRWLFVVFSIVSVDFTFFTNPFTAPLWIAGPLFLLFLSLYAGLVIAQIYRYRYVSTLVQRQQTKWVVFGLTSNIVLVVGALVPTLIFPQSLYPLAFPLIFIYTAFIFLVTIGIAILRYRLWDIDVLINRTLVYGSLTALLALVYFGLIIGLQSLLHGLISQDNSVAIVLSTLAIYVLFQPLRQGIQRLIDRRFYRRKYDAAKTIAAFSSTLRQEVDLATLRQQLLAVVQETIQPAHVSLWLRPSEHDSKQRAPWRATPPVSSEER